MPPQLRPDPDAVFRQERVVPDRTSPAPTPEEYSAWLSHPVTRWVAYAYERKAAESKELWMSRSWESEQSDPIQLRELRTRADCYSAFLQCNYEDFSLATTKK